MPVAPVGTYPQVRESTVTEDGYRIFDIPKVSMPKFLKKMAKVRAKCEARELPFHLEVVGESVTMMEYGPMNWAGNRRVARIPCDQVVVRGLAIINGWSFVARVEHNEVGNVVYTAPTFVGVVPDEYRTSESFCEHCNTNRWRNETFLVVHEDGTFKQVGRTCLKEYIGIDAEAIAQAMQIIHEAHGYSPPMGALPGPETDTVLLHCAEAVRKFGFKKKDAGADATAEVVWTILHPHIMSQKEDRDELAARLADVGFDPYNQEARKMVDEALEWLENTRDPSDYIHNLRVITAREDVDKRHMGFLASLFAAHARATKRAEERRARQAEAVARSNHVGEVGKRIEFGVKEVRIITTWPSNYGLTKMYKMTDPDDNVFIWMTTSDIPENVCKMKGTVRAHEEYQGVAQTVMTRCAVLAEREEE